MTTGAGRLVSMAALLLLAGCSGEDSEESENGSGAGGTLGGGGSSAGSSGCAGSGGACSGGQDGGQTQAMVITSAEDGYWQLGQLVEVANGDADVTVDDAAEAQIWEGFGGCFTELGWVYLSELSEEEQAQAIELLFGSEGARLTWGRIPIGGNDYVVSRYTLDDTGSDVIPDENEENRPTADLELESFSIDRDLQHVIPYIKAAQAVKPDIRFWAVPWTPPVWMKTGYKEDDSRGGPAARPSYYDGGSMRSDDAVLTAHAQYFVRFVQAYEDQGIDVEFVAPQNEPGFEMNYPSCRWDETTYARFIGQYLGPALSDASLDTQVMLGSLDNGEDSAIVSAVCGDPTALGFCAVAGVGYGMVSASKVSPIQAAGVPVWVSEHMAGNYYWEPTYQTTAPNDMAYAIETWGLIRDAITRVGVSAYNAWHMVLDEVGTDIDATNEWAQNSLLVVDAGQLVVTPEYYVFRHFSRYVEPGATVIGTSGGDAVAFENPDGSLVVVLYNSGAAKTMTVAIGGKVLQFTVPGNGFATLVAP